MLSKEKNHSYLELESKMKNFGSIWGTGFTPVCSENELNMKKYNLR